MPDLSNHAPAGLLRRLAAAFYDSLLLAGVLMTTSYVVVIARGGTAVPSGDILFRLFVLAQVTMFFVGFWVWDGQTLGMRAWRIRLETLAGSPPGCRAALLRFAVALLSVAALGAGFWWALADSGRRTWHDRAAGTRVVRC